MFKVVVSNFAWDEPSPMFGERDAALGYAKGVVGRLTEMDAPFDVMVSVLKGDELEAGYSVESWRLAVKWVGEKMYG
jgi:hypothetical protein